MVERVLTPATVLPYTQDMNTTTSTNSDTCPRTGRSAAACDSPDHRNCPDLGRAAGPVATCRYDARCGYLAEAIFVVYAQGRAIGVATGTRSTLRSIWYSGIDTNGNVVTRECMSAKKAAEALAHAVAA